MFADEVAFTGLADERVPRLDLLKWSEPEISMTVSGAVPEVPGDWEVGEVVAGQVDAVDVADKSLLSSLATLPEVGNGTLDAVQLIEDVG